MYSKALLLHIENIGLFLMLFVVHKLTFFIKESSVKVVDLSYSESLGNRIKVKLFLFS